MLPTFLKYLAEDWTSLRCSFLLDKSLQSTLVARARAALVLRKNVPFLEFPFIPGQLLDKSLSRNGV